ncbi:MAG: peptidoglycan DD-metalloendopeptidase family protein [Phaeovulum sp.]|uniref:peptidoglycan DD-metalloendopeptidase family protein n=1 Tax=Phaeovulum sp. TaxID=2934796 RepID=UPI00272FB756|nr:peptidoglycan DD-metalloendopeptidase family protein [Phaeovulum sp.]MDP2063187.1 peptidoglycan DD-metalloendopeptidase family protein [Phaeovulum sp.]MDP3861608.1 peptidoglycan DD-metalloendopeptidase family protein [Phaeovulum sp.]
MPIFPRRPARALLAGAALLALASCDANGNFDFDLRNFGNSGLDTSAAVRQAVNPRPEPDARGVISYPTYQVVVAKRGDSVAAIANRVGLGASELAAFNALRPDTVLNGGEVLALPGRVAEAAGGGATGRIDITELASGAIDRATAAGTATAHPATTVPGTSEPIRHKVERGETAYSIARYYSVDVRSLADWNGLPADLSVREGQYLMIPTPAPVARSAAATAATTAPGQGSPTPLPPSAAQPLPANNPPAASAPLATPPATNLGSTRTATTAARMAMPVTGAIIRPYEKKKNDGVDIAAAPGSPVRAAEAGIVAAITRDTDGVPILVIRHDNNLLTVYANIDALTVAKGDRVTRGQVIAKVRAGEPGFVHFEVRDGFESTDPMPYLQ